MDNEAAADAFIANEPSQCRISNQVARDSIPSNRLPAVFYSSKRTRTQEEVAAAKKKQKEFRRLDPLQQLYRQQGPSRKARKKARLQLLAENPSPQPANKDLQAAVPLVRIEPSPGLVAVASKIKANLIPHSWQRPYYENPRWSVTVKCNMKVI
jgi:hypothetical protein